MKLVLTLLARDEADVVDAQIAFHLHAGVDFVIATDNRSEDGTTEILERYQRAGRLLLLREHGDDMRQDRWVTRMARHAAAELGADWVINADADEFWWPRSGSLKDVLASVPERYGVVRGLLAALRPASLDGPVLRRADDGAPLRARAPRRQGDDLPRAPEGGPPRRPRGLDRAREPRCASPRLAPLRGWHPLEVLHFSLRSPEQLGRKAVRDWVGWTQNPHGPTLHQELAYEAQQAGRLDEYYDSFVVTDEALAAGVADGSLARDTRLRDALRAIAAPGASVASCFPRRAALDSRSPSPGSWTTRSTRARPPCSPTSTASSAPSGASRCSKSASRRSSAARSADCEPSCAEGLAAAGIRVSGFGPVERHTLRPAMKLVMTLLARDEADVVESWLAFHLNAGADFVIATDNRSEDGTTEILERYAREGHVHLIREPGEDLRQDEWVTRMARLAATDFGADWVINSDADEFWWPRGASLRDVLGAVPERYGIVSGVPARSFVPRPDDGRRSPSG